MNLPYPSLALPIVAALTPDSWDIKIVSDYVEDADYDGDWDLVGVSAMTSQAPRAYQIAREFKKRGVPTVMGGFHCSLFPDEALQHFTSVVIGEAELNWDNVVRDAERGALKRKYQSERLADMDEIPSPRYDLVAKMPHLSPINRSGYSMRSLPLQAVRGCPMRCEFCSVHRFFGGKYRFRPVEHVIRDIKSANYPWFIFVDDNIMGNRKYALELFEAMKPLNLTWGSQCNVKVANDREMLKAASDAGCVSLFLGVESLDPTVLKRYNKSFNQPDMYKESFKKIYDAGIMPMASMIVGMEGEEPESIQRTLDFLLQSPVGTAYLFILTPAPGTPLFDRLDAEGRIFSKDWSLYNGENMVITHDTMTTEQVQEGFWRILREFYSVGHIIRRALWPPLSLKRTYVRLKMNLIHRRSVLQHNHPLNG